MLEKHYNYLINTDFNLHVKKGLNGEFEIRNLIVIIDGNSNQPQFAAGKSIFYLFGEVFDAV